MLRLKSTKVAESSQPLAKRKKFGGRVKGTPNKATAEVKALARQYGEAAIHKLATLAGLCGTKGTASTDAGQIAAIKELLERGYGRTAMAVEEGGYIAQTENNVTTYTLNIGNANIVVAAGNGKPPAKVIDA